MNTADHSRLLHRMLSQLARLCDWPIEKLLLELKDSYVRREKPRLYWAAPLFDLRERDYNSRIALELCSYFDVYLPQLHGELVQDLISRGLSPEAARQQVARNDYRALVRTDVLVIDLDGRVPDEGAVHEEGVCVPLGKQCVGFQTGPNRATPYGNNPMVDAPLEQIFQGERELLAWAALFASRYRTG